MSSQAQTKLKRDVRSMPKWVSENNDRIGPKPPTPPVGAINHIAPALPPKNKNNDIDPDYEVIEFSGQQYSNEPMKSQSVTRTKTPESKVKCTLCGSNNPWVTCGECGQQIFCASCDDMYHKHPKRKNHVRKAIEQNLRPPLPPKTLPGQPGPSPPVAPPRRSKRGIMTPLLQRKDQVINSQSQTPPSPTPSLKSNGWQDRMGSLKRDMNLMNRPLPDPPKSPSTPQSEASISSRSETPRSAFDSIQRPPSVTLEKIKSKANATLDRMAILQQRYRQQKEEQQRNRSDSISSQNLSFDQWTNISPSPSNFRSGSMSSGLNSSHFDLSDDSHFNFNHQRQHALAQHQPQLNRPRTMSSSVFNLNQINRRTPQDLQTGKSWGMNAMQQAQSMAQLNCMGCNQASQWSTQQQPQMNHHHMHMDDFNSQQLNRSNLSLNMPAGTGYMLPGQQHHHHHGYPPPVFMNPRGGVMYPYPYNGGMPIMNPGVMGIPPTARSRATSRAGSRAVSPAMSRKSMTLRRKRNSSFAADDDATDDEDSDEDDRRSLISNRSYLTSASRSGQRQRRMSSISQPGQYDEDENETMNSRRIRNNERRGSTAKSVQSDWVTTRRGTGTLKPNKIYSDLDSEGSGTRALVQAKIQEKLEQTAKKNKARKRSSGSESIDEKPKPIKVSTEVQVGTVSSKSVAQQQVQSKKIPSENESEEVSTEEKEPEEQREIEQTKQAEETEEEEEAEVQDTKDNTQDTEAAPVEADETDDLGPPPTTPDYEWECEFCTFVNEPNVKICTICCKTPSLAPKKHKAATQPKPTVEPTIQKKQNTSPKTEAPRSSSSPTKSKIITKAEKKTSPMKTITNGVSKLKITSSENESDQYDNTNQSSSSGSGSKLKSSQKKLPKESVEDIWTALDENIQATADEVLRKSKVSTGCGTSPPPRCLSEKSDVVRVAKEIGTSPPPQSISTQTYDVLPLQKVEAPNEKEVQGSGPTHSMNNAPNFGNHAQFFDNTNSTNISNPNSQWTTLDHLSHNNERISDFFRDKEDRYRSINDLRYRDTDSPHMLNGLGRHQSSYAELLTLQRTQSQLLNNGSFSNFNNDMPRYEPKPARDPETELYILLKEAELYKYTPEELHAALKNCGPDTHPVQWLRDNWPKLIQTVRSLATKYGQERIENTIGTISQQEARDALRMHGGNIWQAVSECIEQRQRKYRDISSKGNFSREDIVTALTTHQGNVELALMDLGRTQLKPFLMRIWGSPGGVENESGTNVLYQTSQAPPSETSSTISTDQFMKNDIHEFLSANASECLQTPSISGAFMQDFHSPTSQTHEMDNASANLESIHSYPNISSNYSEQVDDTFTYNKHMLKDLETLIGNMEQNQAKQNKDVLQSIEGMLEQLINKRDMNDNDMDPEAKRILMKSPINTPKAKFSPKDNETLDIKAFVWQNIQEIVPSLVQQVKAELGEPESKEKHDDAVSVSDIAANTAEPTAIDSDKFILEEIIQPNIKEASFREEMPPEFIYASEIANFRMEFDRGLEREHEHEYELETLEDAKHHTYKMFIAPIEMEVVENKEDNFKEAVETTNKTEQTENQTTIDAVIEDEAPSTSKASLKRTQKNAKTTKQIKKTNIPKLQDKQENDSNIKEKIITKEEEKNKQEKEVPTASQPMVITPTENVQQTTSSNQTKKRRRSSKIPIRRATTSVGIKAIQNGKQTTNLIELQNTAVPDEPYNEINTTEQQVKNEKAENLQNNAEDSRSSTTSENSRAEEIFQDLEELSSEESEENAITNGDQHNTDDDLTSGEEELFSAGSGSAKSSPQLQEESTVDEYLMNENENNKGTTNIKPGESNNGEYEAISGQSRQNLSELVQDTQRLIKQMKDEITLDEYESTDEDDYSEDYSVEYDEDDDDDDDDEGEWEGEEEEEDDDDLDYENDEELASVFEEDENIVESEELQSDEEQNLSKNETGSEHTDITQTETNNLLLNITNNNISNSLLSSEIDIEEAQRIELTVSGINTEVTAIDADSLTEEQFVLIIENNIPEPATELILENGSQETNATTQRDQTEETRSTLEGQTSSNQNVQKNNIVEEIAHTMPTLDNKVNNDALQERALETVTVDQIASGETLLELENHFSNSQIIGENNIVEELVHDLPTTDNQAMTNAQAISEETLPEPENQSSSRQIMQEDNISEDSVHNIPFIDNEAMIDAVEERVVDTVSTNQVISEEILPKPSTSMTISQTISFNTQAPAALLSEESPTTVEPQINIQSATSNTNNNVNATESSNVQPLSSQNQEVSAPNESSTPSSEINSNVTITTEPLNDTQPTKRTLSKIPKPKEPTTKHSNKKVPLRSKSFSGPPTPIGISSVKAIQQQYLHKQSQFSKNFLQPKPVPPVVRKKSITEAINKLTGPVKDNRPTTSKDGPSTSTGIFRPRTQIRIPKKKYHETCFSDDDYETTSSEDEPVTLEILERKRSVPVFRAYPSLQEPETTDPEELAQKFVDENLVGNIAEAQIAAALVNMKFPQDVSIWAAKECSDLDQAISMLRQECELCMGSYPMNEIVSMLKCTHKCCKQCAKSYFTVQITDRSINDCNCPFCKIPELHNQNGEHEDENLEYFSNLDIFLKSILEPEVHELFQRKLRDRSLLLDPNFKWCVECSSGFFARPKQKRLICPDCGSVTCSQCRKKWEKQHEGITCAQFQEWKDANDPEIQAQGVQEHLAHNGIDCPKCKFRYSLARGGCMHFTCTQCKFEFCYGCARPFMMGAKCHMSPYCAKLGLHAHHPRNCLFYLRDKIPLQLQFLLKENGVNFDVDPIDNADQKSEASSSAAKPLLCPIPIQKETPSGLYDTVCNGDVPDKHAGMCRTHYVEYLTAKVAKAGIDPLPIFDLTDCVQELRRRGIALPDRGPWDTDEIYKNMCSEVIRQRIPLNSS